MENLTPSALAAIVVGFEVTKQEHPKKVEALDEEQKKVFEFLVNLSGLELACRLVAHESKNQVEIGLLNGEALTGRSLRV